MKHRCAALCCIALLYAFTALGQESLGIYNVRDFGAAGDGKTDDTAAFQKALDAVAAKGGGTVLAPRGNYFFAGHLSVPNAVTLKGIWESVPAHNGLRDRGMPKPTDDGTTFLVTEGAGKEDGPPFITLHTNSTLKGVVLYYPEQNANDEPKPYPCSLYVCSWSFVCRNVVVAQVQVFLRRKLERVGAEPTEDLERPTEGRGCLEG